MTVAAGEHAEVLALRFGVPPEFNRIDLTMSPEDRALRALNAVRRSLPQVTREQAVHFTLAQQYMIESMVEGGVVYAATCLARTEGERPRPTVAQFAVAVKSVTLRPQQSLRILADGIAQPGARREVDVFDLPAGEALAVAEDRDLAVEVTVFGVPDPQIRRVRQIQVMVPFPDHRQIAVFALTTECVAEWHNYLDIMAAIAKTIRFDSEGSAIGTALDSSPDRPARQPTAVPSIRDILG